MNTETLCGALETIGRALTRGAIIIALVAVVVAVVAAVVAAVAVVQVGQLAWTAAGQYPPAALLTAAGGGVLIAVAAATLAILIARLAGRLHARWRRGGPRVL